MNAWRAGLAVCAAIGAAIGLANLFVFHAALGIPLTIYGALICALAIFERGRYRPVRSARVSARATATGETFYDPTTGEGTAVFYDPVTGLREYRPTGVREP